MITVDTMISKVRNKTQEINERFLTDEYLIEFLDDGLSDVLSTLNIRYETLLHKTSEPIDVVSGANEYDIPLDCASARIQQLRILDGDEWCKLREMDVNDEVVLLNLSPSFPLYYIIKADKFYIYPTPNKSITDGMIITYTERLSRLDKKLGTINYIINGDKLYCEDLEIDDSNGISKIAANSYISITDGERGKTDYHFRVKGIDETLGYIQIYSGNSSAPITGISISGRYFEMTAADLSNVIPGDVLTVSGSTGNDGDYTIIGKDSTLSRLYVREVVASAIVDGNGISTPPEFYKERAIATEAYSLNKGDMITIFNHSCSVRLPDIGQDYIIAYAIKAAFEKAKEPNQEALLNLQRLAQAIDTLPADRVSEIKYIFRGQY